MIRVTVELVPYGIGEPVEMGTATITNDGVQTRETEGARGSYTYRFTKKGHERAVGEVRDFPRQSADVWQLIARCLAEAGIR